VLLLHHSIAYRHRGCSRSLEMKRASRAQVLALLAECDVRVVLTGHTHKRMVGQFRAYRTDHASSSRRLHRFMEACCGTTTQANKVPAKWGGRDRNLDENSLLVHRIVSRGDRIIWKTDTWWRSHYHGFKNAKSLPGDWTSEIQLWPRS
jgi:hypothetical protein